MSAVIMPKNTVNCGPNNWAAMLRPLLIMLIIFVMFYFSALSHFTLGIDDESGALRTEPVSWARQGRWLLYVMERWIITQPSMVFFPLFFFGLFSSVGYLLLTRAYRLDILDTRTYLLFLLFCAFPTIFFIANFLPNIIGLGVGMAAGCLAIYSFSCLILQEDIRKDNSLSRPALFILALICVAIAAGAYQSLVLVILIGCTGLLAREISAVHRPDWGRLFSIHAMLATVLIGGVLLSEVIGHVVRVRTGLDTGYVSDWYSNGYLQPGLLMQDPSSVLRAAVKELKAVYGGSAAVYGYVYYTFPFLLALGFAGLMHSAKALRWTQIAALAIYAIAILLVPFLLNLLTGGELPYRALIAVPIVFWLFAMFAVFSKNNYIRRTAIAVLTVVILQSLYTFSMLQTTRRLALQHDENLASQIFDRIATSVPDFDRKKVYPIDFFGAYEFETVYPKIHGGSSFAGSFFQWDEGNRDRIITFMKVLGYANFKKLPDDRRAGAALEMMTMPVWPQRDSVKYLNGTILIRLGDTPSPIVAGLMSKGVADMKASAFWEFDTRSSIFRVVHAAILGSDQAGLTLSEGDDVQVIFTTGQPAILNRCRLLGIKVRMAAGQADVAQFFYLQGAMSNFDGSHFARDKVGGNDELNFLVLSPNGFQDKFRFDPVMKSQKSRISNIAVRCLQSKAS